MAAAEVAKVAAKEDSAVEEESVAKEEVVKVPGARKQV